MKFISAATVIAVTLGFSEAFVVPIASPRCRNNQPIINHDGKTISSSSTLPLSGSRLDGNQSDPTFKDISTMDEMIKKMVEAEEYELPNAVRRAFRVCSSPQFFLRIATLADQADDAAQKEKLSTLAANLATTIEAVVSTTKGQFDDRAKEVEDILKQASEPSSGEFLVPLSTERGDAMRQALVELEPSKLDESFLSTVDAWIVKSHQDGMDGMVTILQKLLQQYAGIQVSRARAAQQGTSSSEAANLLEKLLALDTDTWDTEIRNGTSSDVTTSGLVAEIQRTMESVILGLENGSMAQRIQAEYLKELVTRAEAVETN